MNCREFIAYHKLILREDYLEGDYDEIYNPDTGELEARYYEDGYHYLDANVNYSLLGSVGVDVRYSILCRVAINLTYLNRGVGVEVVKQYISLLCDERINTDKYRVNVESIYDLIDRTYDGSIEIRTNVAKYYWVSVLKRGDKSRIVCRHNGHVKRVHNVRMIDAAVNILKDENLFITSSEISRVTKEIDSKGMDSRSVLRNMTEEISEDIDNHNISFYNTKSFSTYMKWCNIHSIAGAIRAIQYLNKKVTKGRVAEYASVHRHTVRNLWGEDEVQKALNDYNDYVRALSKEKIAI